MQKPTIHLQPVTLLHYIDIGQILLQCNVMAALLISSSHANPLQTQRASLVSASQVRHVDELVTVQAKKM
jgi:hypothetical protein